jgi:hypothetical protein
VEHRCEVCGRIVGAGDLRPWTVTARRRVFQGSRVGQAERPLYQTVEEPRDMKVCEACAARLQAGESVHLILARRVNRQMLMFAALLILIVILTPILLPYVRMALWLNR